MAPRAILIGAPGSGKTTIGRLLGQALDCAFRDTDADVAAAAGMSIHDLFITRGEDAFRTLEQAAVQSALQEHDGVLAVGGGALQSEEVRTALIGRPVVWLQVEPGEAVSRVGISGPRPVLLGNVRGQWAELLQARRPWYEGAARWSVETSGRNPDDVVSEIVRQLRGEHG